MQWSCPHCGVTLAVPFDTLGTGWSFSRCYKCGGFALIRRAEVNIIKVDKAPPGERVILPEAGTDLGAGLLNEEAAQKFAKHTSRSKADKPTIKPAKSLTPPPPPQNLQKFDELEHLSFGESDSDKTPPEQSSVQELRKKTLPFGIVMAGLFAIASGIYLYNQGQSAYQKVKTSASDSHIPTEQKISSISREPSSSENSANPQIANAPIERPLSDRALAVKEEKLVAVQKLARPVITDQVQESAMAPVKSTMSVMPAASATMLVQTRLKRVSLHGGPGMQFPVTGIANPDIRYVVADWKDRWFKIALNSAGALSDVGWIRNDLVQIMPSTFLGNTMPEGNHLRQ
jgi:hypothetical protein